MSGIIAVTQPGKIKFLRLGDITHITACGNYVEFHLVTGKRFLSRMTLKQVEQANLSSFIRISRRTIVNVVFINYAHSETGRFNHIVLVNDVELRTSKAYLPNLLSICEIRSAKNTRPEVRKHVYGE